MKILVLGNSSIFQRKIYPALKKLNNVKIELASKRKISTNLKISKYYQSYNEALKKTDAKIVYISLINSEHYTWTIKSLNKDKHVIIDKPIALNLNQTKKIIDLASKKRLLLSETIVFHKHIEFSTENGYGSNNYSKCF